MRKNGIYVIAAIVLILSIAVIFDLTHEFDVEYGRAFLFDEDSVIFKISAVLTRVFDVPFAIFLTLIAAFYFQIKHRIKLSIYLCLTMIVSILIVILIKYGIGRIRPEYLKLSVPGFSFPSGHSAAASALMSAIVNAYPFKSGKSYRFGVFIASLIAVSIALTRIIIGVHYLTDIFAGLLIGLFSANLCMYLMKTREYKW